MREKLEKTRRAGVTLHFTIIAKEPKLAVADIDGVVEVDGYLISGLYPDGRLGEIFIRVSKEIASMGPMLDQFAIASSIALQHGAPVDELFSKFVGTRFEPSGPVKGVAGITRCTSPLDLIGRYLIAKYGQTIQVVDEVGI